MGYWDKLLYTVSIALLVLKSPLTVAGHPKVPCYFIFGDSLVDNGNNNGLKTTAKANYPPYGVDFPDGPTGRFTNGQNFADFLAKKLGFEHFIPPFANVKREDILTGVNYGSGGSGIRDETGRQLGEHISLGQQLQNHQTTITAIANLQRNKTLTKEHLSKCIYTVVMGSNDYINNYFAPESYNTSLDFTPNQYAASLTNQYSQHLTTLHKLGARKVAIFGLGPIGCIPAEVSKFGKNGSICVTKINDAVKLFNNRLKSLVDDFNRNLKDTKFIYINYLFPKSKGNTVTDPCCEVLTKDGAIGQCVPKKDSCHLPNLHFYFDGFHPSQTIFSLTAKIAYVSLSKLI